LAGDFLLFFFLFLFFGGNVVKSKGDVSVAKLGLTMERRQDFPKSL
jgi:hypothetical protein